MQGEKSKVMISNSPKRALGVVLMCSHVQVFQCPVATCSTYISLREGSLISGYGELCKTKLIFKSKSMLGSSPS